MVWNTLSKVIETARGQQVQCTSKRFRASSRIQPKKSIPDQKTGDHSRSLVVGFRLPSCGLAEFDNGHRSSIHSAKNAMVAATWRLGQDGRQLAPGRIGNSQAPSANDQKRAGTHKF